MSSQTGAGSRAAFGGSLEPVAFAASLHPRHEDGRGVGVPLDVTHSAISGACEVQPEVEATGAGAEREAEEARVVVPGRQAGGR